MKYSDSIDYLTSSILYLATHEYYWARTPRGLARELSLDEERLQEVFNAFPSLFRKSLNPGDYGQHFYSLQARYAQREGSDTAEPEKISYIKPLETDKIQLLLDFVLKMTEHEKIDSRTEATQNLSKIAITVSSLTAIFVAVTKLG